LALKYGRKGAAGSLLLAPSKNAMDFFRSAIDTLATVLTLIGSGLGFWGIVNLLEGYGNDNQSRHVPRSVRE
jgi:hypothetical protein